MRLALLFTATLLATAAWADDAPAPPRIVSLATLRDGHRVSCRVWTAGLPDERAVSALQGGLPSTVDFVLDLLDSRARVISSTRVRFRIAFDLWEEVFHLTSAGQEKRLDNLDAVRDLLAKPDPFPIAPIEQLALGERYRIRATLETEAIAARERERFGSWMAGEADGATRDPDRREASLSLGRLIRLAYGGQKEGAAPAAAAVSDWFRREELESAPADAN